MRVEPLNRAQWSRRFLDDERPLLERLSGSIGAALQAQLGELDADGEGLADLGLPQVPGMSPDAMLRQMMSMMGPMLLGMMAGSTAGHLATRAMGHYELPLPRPTGGPLTMVLSNVDAFADDWSLPRDGIRLWVCLSDVAHHQVLSIPHVRAHLDDLLSQYVSAFSEDPREIERRMESLGIEGLDGGSEPELEALQRLAGNPELLLGAMQSDEQRALVPRLEAVVATVEGYVDWVLDRIGGAPGPRLRTCHRGPAPTPGRGGPRQPVRRAAVRLGTVPGDLRPGRRLRRRHRGTRRRVGAGRVVVLDRHAAHPRRVGCTRACGSPGSGSTPSEVDLDGISFEVPDFPDLDA